MAKRSSNPGKLHKRIKAILAGNKAHPIQSVSTVVVKGKTYGFADLLATLASHDGVYVATEDAEHQYVKALECRTLIEKDAMLVVQVLTGVIKSVLGKQNPDLEYYDIKPERERTPPTPEESVSRTKQSNATRAARGTLGPKQKAQIKGVVATTTTTGDTTSTTTDK